MNNKRYTVIASCLIVLYAVLQVFLGTTENRFLPIVMVLVMLVFVVLHGYHRYGIKQLVVFFLITFIISWTYENISVVTGFPFGNYHYTDKLGFKLLYVPLIIMPAYVSTGYLAWMIAHILLNTYEKKLEGRNIFMVPFIASFIMVMWDLAMDPYISTVSKNWTWEEGGCYYGVPFVNYMGWFLCVFTIYILFALYQNRYGEKPKSPAVVNTKSFWIHCSIMYALLQLFLVFKTAFGSDGSITALDGHVWSMSDLYSGTLLVSIFTMIFVSVLAINHVLARKNSE